MIPVPCPPTPMAAITIWSLGPFFLAFSFSRHLLLLLFGQNSRIPQEQYGTQRSRLRATDPEIPAETRCRVRIP